MFCVQGLGKELKLQTRLDRTRKKGKKTKPLSEQRKLGIWRPSHSGRSQRARACCGAVKAFKAAVAAEEKKAVALTKSIDQTRDQVTALVRVCLLWWVCCDL